MGARIRASRLAEPYRAWRACVAAFLVVGLIAANATGAGRAYRKFTTRVGRGVHYTFIKDSRGPWRIRVLSVKLSAASTLDVALAHNKLNGLRETTSSMARRHGAIAAVNGDFGLSRPMHVFAEDGHLVQTSPFWGRNFAVDRSETDVYLKHPRSLRVWAELIQPRRSYDLQRVNEGAPRDSEMALFTPTGSSLARPPKRGCSARMFPLESPRSADGGSALEAVQKVVAVRCGYGRMQRSGGRVLATPRSSVWASRVASLQPGDRAGLGWSLGGAGVFDTIGGYPPLIKNGAIQWEYLRGEALFYGRNPRTGVGYDEDEDKVLLVTVDGRRPRYSVGMTLGQFAQMFKSLGAEWALNLDGGGSTTTVVRGDVRNRPSDGFERPVSSALLVLPGPDPGEISGNLELGPSGVPIQPGAEALSPLLERVARDPGSTGGLTSALVDRGLELPANFRGGGLEIEGRRSR